MKRGDKEPVEDGEEVDRKEAPDHDIIIISDDDDDHDDHDDDDDDVNVDKNSLSENDQDVFPSHSSTPSVSEEHQPPGTWTTFRS